MTPVRSPPGNVSLSAVRSSGHKHWRLVCGGLLLTLGIAVPSRAQDQNGDELSLKNLRLADDRQIRRGLSFATNSTVALSAGPGVGGANFRLKRSRFFERISSTQINLRIYLTANLAVQETPDLVLEMMDSVQRRVKGEQHQDEAGEELAERPAEPEREKSFEDHFDFMGAATNDPTPFPRLRLFTLLNYGDATASTDFALFGVGRSELKVSTTSYRVGVGFRLDFCRYFAALPTFSVSYNHVRGDADGNGLDSALLRLVSNRRLVNWRSECFTFIPELELRVTVPYAPWNFELRITGELSYLETRTFTASTSIHEFSSRSLIGALTTEFDWNTTYEVFGIEGLELHVIPAIRYVHILGDADTALGSNEMVGAELSLETDCTDYVPFSSRLGVRGTYLWGVDLEAWSVSVSHEF